MATVRLAAAGVRGFVAAGRVLDAAELQARGGPVQEVRDKATGARLAQVHLATAADIEDAMVAGAAAEGAMAALQPGQRVAALRSLAAGLRANSPLLARTIAQEAGKPIALAEVEVARAAGVCDDAAAVAHRGLPGQEWRECGGGEGRAALLTRRFPLGLLSFVSPFNFPLNLAVHKAAPAIAAGCPFVLKPSDAAPLSALLLAELLAGASLPHGAFSVLPCALADAAAFSEHRLPRMVSFTGSPRVGWGLKARAGAKRVALELGGNAACIVDEGADVAHAAARIAAGAFGYAGQTCISVQRVLAHRSLLPELRARVADHARHFNAAQGDPTDRATRLGPLISAEAAARVAAWVADARDAGATLLAGGASRAPFHEATVLEGVPHGEKVWCEEVFGPVVALEAYDDFDEALALANEGEFGLQLGVFAELRKCFRAYERSHVGGVVANDIPSVRIDAQAYGGVKASGLGREGALYAAEEFTELRTLLMADL